MALQDLLHNDRMEMLKWVSERNVHVPLTDLAFMLDLSEDNIGSMNNETGGLVYEYCAD